jgi:WD40 repeat protein
MRIVPAIPVIGTFLSTRRARIAAHAAREGDLQAVRELARIVVGNTGAARIQVACEALRSLASQDAIDVFCGEVLDLESPVLETLAVERGYVPREAGQKALFFYLTGQEAALHREDPEDHVPSLAMGYTAAPPELRERALQKARDPRPGCLLARALAGRSPEERAVSWSYGEWVAVLSGLCADERWDDIWTLVPLAPPGPALLALHRIRSSGHVPGGDLRQVAEELLQNLPESWTPPVAATPIRSAASGDSRSVRLAFSHDGSLLAAGTSDGRVQVWQVSQARLVTSHAAGSGSIGFLAVLPDNTGLVAGGDQGTLVCISLPAGTRTWHFDDAAHRIASTKVTESGEILAGDTGGRVLRISGRTGAVLNILEGHSSPVTALCHDPDSGITFTGHADGTIGCHDRPAGSCTRTLPGTGDPICALAYSSETGQLLVTREYGLPFFCNAGSGEPVMACAGYAGVPSCVTYSADRHTVAAGGSDNVLRIWRASAGKPVAELPLYNRFPTCCAMTPDGSLLACGCNEGTVFFIDIPEGKILREFRGQKTAVTACVVSPDGSLLAAAGGDGMVTLRAVPGGEIRRTLRRPAGAVTAIVASGGVILAGSADGSARFFSPGDEGPARSIDMYTPSIRALAASGDGKYFACAGSDATLRIWDTKTGSLAASCEGIRTSVHCLAFLPEGDMVISGGWDGKVRFWSVPEGKVVRTLAGHTSVVTCCCTDPEGRILITGSNDTTIRIHDLAGSRDPVVIRDAGKEVSCCAVSPDGTLLAMAGPEPEIRLYRLPAGIPAGTIEQVPGKPSALAFTGDGLALAAGYACGTLAFYAVHDRRLIRTIAAHPGAITGICPLPDRDAIATAGEDGRVRIFRIPFQQPLARADPSAITMVRDEEESANTGSAAVSWRFLTRLLALRFQNEIGLCPVFRDAGAFDIQIVG